MNRTCVEPHRKHHDLSCFEYVDIYGEKKSCFQCFCSCDALDTACERAVSCDFATADLLDSALEDISDRIRVPWVGGAMKVDNHAVAVTTLFCFYLIVGSINMIALGLSSIIFAVFLTRMYRYVRRSGVKSIYFFLLSMLHTVTSLVLYSCKIFLRAETIHIYYFYFWLMVYLSVLYNFKQDAGKIAVVQSKNTNHILYCDKCTIVRPVRASHCRFCDVCVDRYDHHNIWFDQCVGSSNHVSYLILLLALINLTFSTTWDFFSTACGFVELSPNFSVPNCKAYILGNRSSVLFSIGLFSCAVLLVTLYHLIIQMKLITFNLTGYEERCLRRGYPIHDDMLRSHYYHSPFNKGFKQNWMSFIISVKQRVVNKHVDTV